jgi:hypothetical protein
MRFLKIFTSAVLGVFLVSALALASGGFYQYFSDVDEGDWYMEAVHSLRSMGVVDGYGDGSYQPTWNVNRAELAVMLDRFNDYLEYPQGEDWVEYSNDFYSVTFPGEVAFEDECMAASALELDFGFGVYCFSTEDLDDLDLEEIIAEIGDQLGDDRREVRKEIEVNDEEALFVTVTAATDRGWEINFVIMEMSSDHIIYMISDAGMGYPEDFEYFYSTFVLE